MTRIPRKKQVRGEYTRLGLLQTAKVLMAEKGYEGVSVNELTQRAGVSVGSFYHHFKDKEDLLVQAIDDDSLVLRQFLREMRTLPVSLSQEERALKASRMIVDFVDKHSSAASHFFLGIEKLPLKARQIIQEDLRHYREEMIQDLESAVEAGLMAPFDIKLTSEAIYGAVVQLLLLRIRDPEIDREPIIQAITLACMGILRAMSGTMTP